MPEERIVETAHGPARVVTRRAKRPVATVVLSHGAGRGIDGHDLVAVAKSLPTYSINTSLVEQPWVARGRKVADRPQVLDQCLATVLDTMRMRVPLILAGRSAGSRSAMRLAKEYGAKAAIAMAFPLHPPGRPEKSRVEELLNAGVPTLVIQGEKDPMGRPEEFPPGTQMRIIPAANHGFGVPKSAPISQDQVYRLAAKYMREWILQDLLGS